MNDMAATPAWDVQPLEWGRFSVDGGAMFGILPKAMWERMAPADLKNRIRMSLRGLLIRGHGITAVVDCGCGDKLSDKMKTIYGLEPPEGGAMALLGKHGVRVEDVTHLIITHLHFDHVGGATLRKDNGLVATFPNARVVIQAAQLAAARNPTPLDRAAFLPDDYEPLAEQGRLTVLDGPTELAPGLSIELAHGHTPGQQMVKVRRANDTVVFPGDLLPVVGHLSLSAFMAFDLEPKVTVAEKSRFLASAVEQGYIVVFDHDPDVIAVRLRQGERSVEVAERIAL